MLTALTTRLYEIGETEPEPDPESDAASEYRSAIEGEVTEEQREIMREMNIIAAAVVLGMLLILMSAGVASRSTPYEVAATSHPM
jgi:hypothetical protein